MLTVSGRGENEAQGPGEQGNRTPDLQFASSSCVSCPAHSEYCDTKHGSIRLRRQLASYTKHPIFSCLHYAVKPLLLETKLLLRIKSLGVPPGEHDQQSCVHPSFPFGKLIAGV